jgi:uncharacterized protein (DUF433 family)
LLRKTCSATEGIVVPMDWGHGIVSRDPDILNGDLAFAGTRVTVKNLVDYLAAGDTLEQFLDNFPGVSRGQAEGYLRMSLRASEESMGAGTSG